MRCKRMKEIILTEYIDGKLKGDALQEVESHLGLCPGCRRLAEEAMSVSSLFKSAKRHEAPPKVWNAVRAAVNTGPARTRFAWRIPERLRSMLLHPKPAFVIYTATALILFAVTIAYLMPGNGSLQNKAEQDDIFLISSIDGGDEEAGFGTPADDIFL